MKFISDIKKYKYFNFYSFMNKLMNKNGITHLIIYGNYGSGKKKQLETILLKIYKTKENLKKNSLIINCGEGKGINFIRDKLTFFAKSIIHKDKYTPFKSIILLNADNLTIEAQSVLRRSIELYSNSTRFFITTNNIDKIMLPIQSRFYTIHNYNENFYKEKIQNKEYFKILINEKNKIIEKHLNEITNKKQCMEYSKFFCAKGIHSNDLIEYIFQNEEKIELVSFFNLIKNNYKNEELLIFTILFSYMRNFDYLEMFEKYNEVN